MRATHKSGYVVLTCEFYREGRRWVALCEELGTSTFGRSLPEAERKLGEAIELHLNTLEDVNERDRFFSENHVPFFEKRPTDFNACRPFRDGDVYFRPCVRPVGELSAV